MLARELENPLAEIGLDHLDSLALQIRIQETEVFWNLLEEEIERRGLPERAIYALADAASGYKVRNATYRPVAEITNQIASRDFKAMVKSGLLEPVGEKRGRCYSASQDLKAMRDAVRRPRRIEDPFKLVDSGMPFLPGMKPGT